jgi:3-oxoadipate enol-lactonase
VKLYHRLEDLPGAPVLVLINSLGTTLELWDRNVDPFAESFRVLRFDQRGHGRSPVPPGPYQVDDLANDVIDLLDDLEIDRAHFCGISLGGAVAMSVAATAPARVERLVVACSSPKFGPSDSWHERARLVRAEGVSAISELVVGRWFTAETAVERPEEVAAFRRMLEETPVDGYAASCEAVAAWDFRQRLAEIRLPTLVIAAAEDRSAPPEHGRTLAEGIPGARFELLEDAAHLANVERPEQFCRLVLAHLAAPVRG